jgi:hypothetical protein
MDDGRAPLGIPSCFFTDRSSDSKQDLSSRGEDAVLRYSVRKPALNRINICGRAVEMMHQGPGSASAHYRRR